MSAYTTKPAGGESRQRGYMRPEKSKAELRKEARAHINEFVVRSRALAEKDIESKNTYTPLSGELSSGARWVGGDLTGGRWLFITIENAMGKTESIADGRANGATDRVSQPVSVLAEASNIDTAIGAAISLYDEWNDPNSGFNKGFLNAKLKVARLAGEFFNNLSLTALRTASQVQMYHNTPQVQTASGLTDLIANSVIMAYFVAFTAEFGSKWRDSKALEQMMEQPNAEELLVLALKVTPEILDVIESYHKQYEEYRAEFVMKGSGKERYQDAEKRLNLLLNVLLPKNYDRHSFEEIKTLKEALRLRGYVVEFVKGGAEMLSKINKEEKVNLEDVEKIKTEAHQMRSIAWKVVGMMFLGIGISILSFIPAMQPFAVALAAIWLVFNIVSFALDFPYLLEKLEDKNLVIGKWEATMAYVRYFLMLAAIVVAIYFGSQFGMPDIMTIASTVFMFTTNTWLFYKTVKKIHEQNKRENATATPNTEALPLLLAT